MVAAGFSPARTASGASSDVWRIIDGVGRDSFGSDVLHFINGLSGADHCAIFCFGDEQPGPVTCASLDGSEAAQRGVSRYLRNGFWQFDPAVGAVRERRDGAPSVMRIELERFPCHVRSQLYSRMSDRVVLFGARANTSYIVSLLRTADRGPYSPEEIERLDRVADLLLSLIAKHAEVLAQRPHLALTDLDEIERCLLAQRAMPVREAQVCARVLFGMSSAAIASELGIGEETVKTYRSRCYQRLGVASPRELLMWYLSIWEPSRAAVEDAPRALAS